MGFKNFDTFDAKHKKQYEMVQQVGLANRANLSVVELHKADWVLPLIALCHF